MKIQKSLERTPHIIGIIESQEHVNKHLPYGKLRMRIETISTSIINIPLESQRIEQLGLGEQLNTISWSSIAFKQLARELSVYSIEARSEKEETLWLKH